MWKKGYIMSNNALKMEIEILIKRERIVRLDEFEIFSENARTHKKSRKVAINPENSQMQQKKNCNKKKPCFFCEINPNNTKNLQFFQRFPFFPLKIAINPENALFKGKKVQ